MEVHIAQVFCVILLIICDIYANSMPHSCVDAPDEAKFKAENLVSNRLGRKRVPRAGDESDDGVYADILSARSYQQKRQRARGMLDRHCDLALSRLKSFKSQQSSHARDGDRHHSVSIRHEPVFSKIF